MSLIMPVYRPRREWLLAAVRSALAQRGCELELIVVDDGNDEPVEATLAGVEDERLRVIRAGHGGVCAARNAGQAAARGRWIRFVDADDAFDPQGTARLVRLAAEEDRIAFGATTICDADLRPIWKMVSRCEGWVAHQALLACFTVRLTSLVFPRAVVERVGEWDPGFRASADWDFVLRAVEHAPVRGETRSATYYRRHGGSLTADPAAGEEGARRVVARYFERHPEERGTPLERQAHARVLAMTARTRFTHGERRDGIRRAVAAARLAPSALVREVAQAPAALVGKAIYRLKPPAVVSPA